MLFSYSSSAQNWKTVGIDTNYFSAGKVILSSSSWGSALRIVFIDSFTTIGTDTIFHFYKTLRDTGSNNCLDTAGATWLGSIFIRQNDGSELYFNSFQDTIFLKTWGSVNDTWTIAKSTDGKQYQATIVVIDTLSIDGVTDSVKTILINAYFNGNPVSDWYDGKQLIISKNHGWVNALDFYRFPNNISTPLQQDPFGAFIDSNIHVRLPKNFQHPDFDTNHLLKIYAPGNEWQIETHGTDFFGNRSSGISHDSIINSQLTSPNSIQVTLRSIYVTSTFSSNYIHTETITTSDVNSSALKAVSQVYPEHILNYDLSGIQGNFLDRWIVDTFCKMYAIHSRNIKPSLISKGNKCYTASFGVSLNEKEEQYILGFDSIITARWISDGQGITSGGERSYSYLKLGDCKMGGKRILASIERIEMNNNSVTIVPNPANSFFTVKGVNDKNATVLIYDMIGKVLLKEAASNPHNISTLSSGFYIIQIVTKERTYVRKLEIVH